VQYKGGLITRAVNEYPDIRISDGANLFGYTTENMNIRSQK